MYFVANDNKTCTEKQQCQPPNKSKFRYVDIYAMEEILKVNGDLKKERGVNKGLLSRTVGKLRTVVSRGADAQADSVDAARLPARHLFDAIDDINIKMEEIHLENDLAYDDESIRWCSEHIVVVQSETSQHCIFSSLGQWAFGNYSSTLLSL